MQAVLMQTEILPLQPEANRMRVRALLDKASLPPSSLLALPELFSTGTLSEGFDVNTAASIARADQKFLAELAREKQAWMLGTTVDVEDGKLVNASLCFDPAGILRAEYHKVHPFTMGGEDRVFAPGHRWVTVDAEGFRLQTAICYDLRFPELFRAGQRAGVTLISVQANWPESRQVHWETLLRARAIENQAYVMGVNCVGTLAGIRYAGGSAIYSPKGETVVALGAEAGLAVAEITPQSVASWRKAFRVLQDRKPDEFWSQARPEEKTP